MPRRAGGVVRAFLEPLAERRPVLAHQGEGVAVLGGSGSVARLSMTTGHFVALLEVEIEVGTGDITVIAG